MSAEVKIEGRKACQGFAETEQKLSGGVRHGKVKRDAHSLRAVKILDAAHRHHQQESKKVVKARRAMVAELNSPPDFWQIPVETLEQTVAPSFHKIVEDAHQRGLSTCHADELGVYMLHPDGRKEYIDCTESRK